MCAGRCSNRHAAECGSDCAEFLRLTGQDYLVSADLPAELVDLVCLAKRFDGLFTPPARPNRVSHFALLLLSPPFYARGGRNPRRACGAHQDF